MNIISNKTDSLWWFTRASMIHTPKLSGLKQPCIIFHIFVHAFVHALL